MLVIILISILGILSISATTLLFVKFTKSQRQRFPILRKLDGKQIHLIMIILLLAFSSAGLYIYREKEKDRLFELISLNGTPLEKSNLKGFEREIAEGTKEIGKKAKHYFKLAENDFKECRYLDAYNNYKKSADIIPTMSAYLNLGLSSLYLSYLEESKYALETGLEMARMKNETEYEIHFLISLSHVNVLIGNIIHGNSLLTNAYQIYKDSDEFDKNSVIYAQFLIIFGFSSYSIGAYEKALKYYDEALKIFETNNDKIGKGYIYGNKALVFRRMRKLDEAIELSKKSIEIFKEVNNVFDYMKEKVNLGNIYLSKKNYENALKAYEEALRIAKSINNLGGRGSALSNIGIIYFEQEDFSKALKYQEEALHFHEMANLAKDQVIDLYAIGVINYKQKRHEDAKQAFEQCKTIISSIHSYDIVLKSIEVNINYYLSKLNN